MFKAEYIEVYYEKADCIKHQGNRASVERYLKAGYYIALERNGYWILIRPPKIWVVVHCKGGKTFTHDMKSAILRYYNRQRISENLINEFKLDFVDSKFEIFSDDEKYLIR